jgi:hypothetical protein
VEAHDCVPALSNTNTDLVQILRSAGQAKLFPTRLPNEFSEGCEGGTVSGCRTPNFRNGGQMVSSPDGCRFRKLDSRVSMMEPTKDWVCNNISEPLDRACAGRVLPERNMSSYVIIIGDVFR